MATGKPFTSPFPLLLTCIPLLKEEGLGLIPESFLFLFLGGGKTSDGDGGVV